nr:uncharacterized protein LOC104085281 [Nicotiana tomentosiformis]
MSVNEERSVIEVARPYLANMTQSRGPINQHAQYGNTYNPNRKNHPNFSWGRNQTTQNQYRPQGNYSQPQKPPQQVDKSTNNLLKKLFLDNQQLRTDFKNLERHVRKLASNQNTRSAGALPSDTKPNPKAQVNAVSLRNGRVLEEVPKKKKYTASPEGELVPKPVEENVKESERSEPEVPKYAKYLKDIVANKRRHTEFETVALNKEGSVRVQSKPPPKTKDPGSFTIPLSFGKQEVDRADRSLVMPEGIIEDVLVRVGNFILPTDFIILDYEVGEEVPIILGRPSLATGGAIIDVRKGKLKMRVGDEEITFNVYKTLKLPKHYEELCMIIMVESKGIKKGPEVNCSDLGGKTELEEVVLQAECVKMIEKRARDER